MRRIHLDDMIHEASVDILKRTCYNCNRDYYEHHNTMIDEYMYPMCPATFGKTFVSQLLMLGDAYLLDDLVFDCIDKDKYS